MEKVKYMGEVIQCREQIRVPRIVEEDRGTMGTTGYLIYLSSCGKSKWPYSYVSATEKASVEDAIVVSVCEHEQESRSALP